MLRDDAKKLSARRRDMQSLTAEFQARIRLNELIDEEDITSRLLERIASALTFTDGDFRIKTKAITVGKRKEEPVTGADIVVVSNYQSPTMSISKGFVAQAKKLELGWPIYQPGRGRLRDQCAKMLSVSNESYVWLYSASSMRVHRANAVERLESWSPDDLQYMYLKTFLIDYLICHHGDPSINFSDLPRLRQIFERLNSRYALLVSATSGPEFDPERIRPREPDGGPEGLSEIIEELHGEPIDMQDPVRHTEAESGNELTGYEWGAEGRQDVKEPPKIKLWE